MAHEALEINKDNIATDSFLSVVANILERYNQKINDENNTLSLDDYKKVLRDINEGFSLYAQLKNTVLDQNVSKVTTLEQQLNTLITDVQSKLDNGDFVGTPGTTDYNNLQNKPILFSGDYADLSNKPFIPLNVDQMEDYEEGTFSPVLDVGTNVNFSSAVGNYTKIGNIVHCTIMFTDITMDSDGSGLSISLPFSQNDSVQYPANFSFGKNTSIIPSSFTDIRGVISYATLILLESDSNYLSYSETNLNGSLELILTYKI